MNRTIPFPSEFKRHTLRDMDKEFVTIFLMTFIALIPFTWFMAQQPVKPFSGDDLYDHINGLYVQNYRVTITKDRPILAKSNAENESSDQPELLKPNASDIIEPIAVESFDERKTIRQGSSGKQSISRTSRIEKLKNKHSRIRETARNMHKLSAPTARVGKSSNSRKSNNFQEFGLTPSSKKSYDLKKFSGLAISDYPAKKQKEVHIPSPITDDLDEVNISYISSFSNEDFEFLFQEALPTVSQEPVFTTESEGNVSTRSAASISEIVLKNQNQIKYCFWTQKRRDSTLNGRVVVEFTINPAGEVISVQVTQHRWNNPTAGDKVEQSIKNLISGWRFLQVQGDSGNVTAGATYIFD